MVRRLWSCLSRPKASLLYGWGWGWALAKPKRAAARPPGAEAASKEEEEGFDPAKPPPFRLGEIRAAIPTHCWVKDPWRSMSYVARDVVAVVGLVAMAVFFDSWVVWPLYWLAQGTMFWAIFVLGHDWRISHRKHHQNHGHVERDEAWQPVFIMWLDFVTYLHHHGHTKKIPWYRGKEWSYLRGALTTLDRDYGWINNIHHDIGTHVIHHLFPQIPHYNLVEATKAARPVLGKYYREPHKSAPFPFHLFGVLARSLRIDHFVSDVGDVIYYQTDDPQLHGGQQDKSERSIGCLLGQQDTGYPLKK
ncbi:hypothetical protein COCNU_04G003240 [Cocos nucifera]|uniref:Fatty acid desaturase domain-containing protein n=1 Tax=Cocos nucifera TaxID=13894 RepID=A0A8K0I4W0_COCNU|nr:hypothetical protein COCNU_04G003240 [Cocos nucifera]